MCIWENDWLLITIISCSKLGAIESQYQFPCAELFVPDPERGSGRRCQSRWLVSCTASAPHLHPQGAIRWGGCDVNQGELSSLYVFLFPPSLCLSFFFCPSHLLFPFSFTLFTPFLMPFQCTKIYFPICLKNDKRLLPPLHQIQVGLNLY